MNDVKAVGCSLRDLSDWVERYTMEVGKFVQDTWGQRSLDSGAERAARVLEEAAELAQAEGVGFDVVESIVNRVYTRPAGDPGDEAGDVMFTLAAWAYSRGRVLQHLAHVRLERALDLPRVVLQERHEQKKAAGTIVED